MDIRFDLSCRRYLHKIGSRRKLYFNARVFSFLYVKGKVEINNGYAEIVEESVENDDPYDEVGKNDIQYIDQYVHGGNLLSFCVTAQVPSNTFQVLMDYDENKLKCYIGIGFAESEIKGIEYADVTGLSWNTDICPAIRACDVTVYIVPIEEGHGWFNDL